MASIRVGLRISSVQLPAGSFVCRQCLLSQRIAKPRARHWARRRNYATTSATTSSQQGPLETLSSKLSTASPQASASSGSSSAAAGGQATRKSSWPESSPKGVGYWLLASAASVFGIVVFGGLTRLTESGLSITEWRPVTGSLPPLSPADWAAEFAKYRASPEFALLNPHMTLAEFKRIYYMEWTHRQWGRVIGLTVVLPTLYLVARRRVSPRMAAALVGISGLVGLQGAIGWWMVRSGLKEDLFAPGSHPRVSQYRLAAHLGTAFVCYGAMLLAGLSVLRTHRLLSGPGADPATALRSLLALQSPALAPLRRAAFFLTALIFTTALSGALVAGLDAGLIYNEFPYMGLGLTPPAAELLDARYARAPDHSDLWWRNMLENPSLAQLDHRVLAVTTVCAVLALFAYARGRGPVWATAPRDVRNGVTGLVHLVLLQAALGISTLVYMVPVPLAAAHQAGSLALLTGALVLGHRLRVPRGLLARVQRRVKMDL